MVDEQLAHQLQRGPVALQRAGHVYEGVHERRAERVAEPEGVPVGTGRAVAAEQGVPHLGADLRRGFERPVDRRLRFGVTRPQQPAVRDQRQVAVLQCNRVEPAAGQVQGVLEAELDAAGDVLADEFPQVALAGDEADERDRPASLAALHEVRDLLDLAGDERLVAHVVREPQDQLVEEQHDAVVAEPLRVPGDLRQPAVERDEPVGVLHRVGEHPGEPARQQVGHQLTAQVTGLVSGLLAGRVEGAMPGGERRIELLRRPPRPLPPLVVRAVLAVPAGDPGGQAGDELVVPYPLAQVDSVGQQRVGAVHGRHKGVRMQGADVVGVAAEHPLFDRLRAEQVVGHQQELLPAERAVVPGEHGGEFLTRQRHRFAAQQRVQHRHEVRLAGAERSVQVDGFRLAGGDGLRDQPERLVEVPDQPVGEDVLPQRRLGVGHPLGELQDEVAVAGPLRDVDDVAQQRLARRRRAGHAAPAFFFRPRAAAGGPHDVSVSSVKCSRPARSARKSAYTSAGLPS